jgi:hypothetical protein
VLTAFRFSDDRDRIVHDKGADCTLEQFIILACSARRCRSIPSPGETGNIVASQQGW